MRMLLGIVSIFVAGVLAAPAAFGNTIVVNDNSDTAHTLGGQCAQTGTGTCSLRDAILFANSNAGADVIHFALGDASVHRITLATDLPDITGAVTINGYSQTGSSANTLAIGSDAVLLVVIRGTGGIISHGLNVVASNVTVKGVVIHQMQGD